MKIIQRLDLIDSLRTSHRSIEVRELNEPLRKGDQNCTEAVTPDYEA